MPGPNLRCTQDLTHSILWRYLYLFIKYGVGLEMTDMLYRFLIFYWAVQRAWKIFWCEHLELDAWCFGEVGCIILSWDVSLWTYSVLLCIKLCSYSSFQLLCNCVSDFLIVNVNASIFLMLMYIMRIPFCMAVFLTPWICMSWQWLYFFSLYNTMILWSFLLLTH